MSSKSEFENKQLGLDLLIWRNVIEAADRCTWISELKQLGTRRQNSHCRRRGVVCSFPLCQCIRNIRISSQVGRANCCATRVGWFVDIGQSLIRLPKPTRKPTQYQPTILCLPYSIIIILYTVRFPSIRSK